MNDKKILIAYATLSGSTEEIAREIAAALSNQAQAVEVLPCRAVASVAGYRAVIVGAPLYMFHLHKDVVRFFQRHQKHLAGMAVAVFAGGPYGANAAADAIAVRKNLDAELAKISWLRLASVLLVGGRFDPARLRFPYNLIPALKQAPPEDARDWDEIRAWAGSLPALLEQQLEPISADERGQL